MHHFHLLTLNVQNAPIKLLFTANCYNSCQTFLPFWLFFFAWLNFKSCHFSEQNLYFAALQRSTSRSALGVSVFPGSAIRRLTGGECGPCIGAARSVALVTLRAETCVSVSILYLCCLGRWWLWGLIRFRRKMKMLRLIAMTVGGLLLASPE